MLRVKYQAQVLKDVLFLDIKWLTMKTGSIETYLCLSANKKQRL